LTNSNAHDGASQKRASPSHVAITGAAGFIGGRLAEMLRRKPGIQEIRGFSRDRHAGLPTIPVRLSDEAAMRKALSGCQAVVHCAFDFQNMGSNLAIARILGRICAETEIRLVHISTAAVYEPLPNYDIDEDFRTSPTDIYKQTKLAIEEELRQYTATLGLDLVILQPTIVYGPSGRAWTDSPIRELLTEGIALPDRGSGLCNAVYVDDVCSAAINALTANTQSAERFIINGPAPVEWREFLGAYDRMIGGGRLKLLPGRPQDSAVRTAHDLPVPSATGPRRESVSGRTMAMAKRYFASRLNAKARSRLNMALRRLHSLLRFGAIQNPRGEKFALYTTRCHMRSDKAFASLNYAPEFDLERGMAATVSYVQHAYAGSIAKRRGRHMNQDITSLHQYN
jgi:nucleoside-diphosphate-sugar epimerase